MYKKKYHFERNVKCICSVGLGTSPAIVYITEVAKPELRGALIATSPTLASLGNISFYIYV